MSSNKSDDSNNGNDTERAQSESGREIPIPIAQAVDEDIIEPAPLPSNSSAIPTAGGIPLGAEAMAERERRRNQRRASAGQGTSSSSRHPALRPAQPADLARRTQANTEANRGAAVVPQLGGISSETTLRVDQHPNSLRRTITVHNSGGPPVSQTPAAAGPHPPHTDPAHPENLEGNQVLPEILHCGPENVNPRQPSGTGPSSSSAAIEEVEEPSSSAGESEGEVNNPARQDSSALTRTRTRSMDKVKDKMTDVFSSIRRKVKRSSSGGNEK